MPTTIFQTLAGDIHIRVYSVSNFKETAGFMDKTDPFVQLTIGKISHKTKIKNNAGGSALFDEVIRPVAGSWR